VRCACIDIGSNTTRLLIADCNGDGLHEVHQRRAFTRIGAAVRADGTIAPAKMAEVAGVVSEQLGIARSYGVTNVLGVATAAIRRAANGAELVGAIADACGLRVVDVGGGSSELVVGAAPDRVGWWASFALGSGDLADGFFRSDPPVETEISAARARVADALGGVDVPRPIEALAVGGSATSLATLAGSRLDADAFKRAFALLASEPSSRIAARFSLDLEPVRLLPAGLLILEAASRLFGVPLAVGRGGIREGVLLEAAR
jgi:exopolyphosphatase/guanosine-5'-triphosphate,3'-diphosphate pyrophosphatase